VSPGIDDAQRSAAKIAAIAYPVALGLVATANFGLRGDLTVDGDAAETARRIAAAVGEFRLSVVFDLLYAAGLVVLLAALYVVLRPVNRYLALLAAVLKLIYAATAVLVALSSLSILRLASDPAYAQGLGPDALHALVGLHSSIAWDQYYAGLTFWALSSCVFAWLWLKSRYIPAPLAAFGLLASAWCAFCAVAYIANPGFANVVNVWVFDMPMALFYLALSGWLLFRGLGPRD